MSSLSFCFWDRGMLHVHTCKIFGAIQEMDLRHPLCAFVFACTCTAHTVLHFVHMLHTLPSLHSSYTMLFALLLFVVCGDGGGG